MPHGGRCRHTPYAIPEKLIRRNLVEPPIAPQYPFELLRHSMDAVPRNHMIKISVKSSYLGHLRRKLLFGKNRFIYRKKAIFTAHTLDMTISSSLKYSPRNAILIPAWKKIYLKHFFGGKHPIQAIYDFQPQILFSTEILKNGLISTPKGHLGSQ